MTLPSAVSLRPVEPHDRAFLSDLYASTRTEELAAVPWTDEQKATFLAQQFTAQDASYRDNYPDAQFSVVELDGVPVGRLYVARLEAGEIRIVDIALLPGVRGKGVGSALVHDLIEAADRQGVIVSLHVEHWNPAVQLYERLGFFRVAANDVHIRMEHVPIS
ncbi:MAG: Acetyltransferase, family [Ilumatobacteraceae bacterium]|nr:Acetyltransferase, family [Ilumatobacteraceae bacterium]